MTDTVIDRNAIEAEDEVLCAPANINVSIISDFLKNIQDQIHYYMVELGSKLLQGL